MIFSTLCFIPNTLCDASQTAKAACFIQSRLYEHDVAPTAEDLRWERFMDALFDWASDLFDAYEAMEEDSYEQLQAARSEAEYHAH
jgi:hypothetical protein